MPDQSQLDALRTRLGLVDAAIPLFEALHERRGPMTLDERDAAREASRRAYLAVLRDLSDEELTREFRVLEHTPELREDLDAEVARRKQAEGAAA
jgi:hypothetical protein